MKISLTSNEFLFPVSVGETLQRLVNNPKDTAKILCFHGYPGIGKTSFAKAYASQFADQVNYKPMNEKKVDASLLDELFHQSASLMSFIGEHDDVKVFERITILDEFHNLAPKQQDQFKVRFDNLDDNERVIICLNTEEDRGRYIKSKVTDAIFSRVHEINFNLQRYETKDFVEEVQLVYRHLKSSQIHAYLPDMRRIDRENKLAKLK